MEVTKEIFLVFTKEGELLNWNCRINQVTSYSDEEIEGRHPADFVPAEEKELVHHHIQEVLANGQTEFECHLETKEGQRVLFEFTGSRFNQDGQTLICLAGRDLTSEQQVEELPEATRLASSEPRGKTSPQGLGTKRRPGFSNSSRRLPAPPMRPIVWRRPFRQLLTPSTG